MTPSSRTSFWNLVQALGWICLRDEAFIDEAADSAHENRWVKRRLKTPDGETKSVKEPDAPHNVFSILVEAELSEVPLLSSINEAQESLVQALRIGDIVALGLQNGIGDLQEVPAIFWTDAKFYFEPDMAGPKNLLRRGASCWKELWFPACEIRRWGLFPPREAEKDPTDEETSQRLSFKLIAARWLLEQPNTGQTADDLAADLIAVAEEGHFTSRREETTRSPGAYFDPYLQKEIFTFGPDQRPATPDEIQKFASLEGSPKIHTRRLTAARDLTLALPSLIKWTESAEGKAWLRVRGLRVPAFALELMTGRAHSELVGTAHGENQCREWLLALMKSNDQDQPKSYYRSQALTDFRISKRGFDRAWSTAKAMSQNSNWGRAGRRSRQ